MMIYINVGINSFSIKTDAPILNVECLEEIFDMQEQIAIYSPSTLIITHTSVTTELLPVFCHLKERFGINTIVDWYRSDTHAEYENMVNNLWGLEQLQERYYIAKVHEQLYEINYNPVNMVIMGECDSIQSILDNFIPEKRMQVVQIGKEIFELDKIVQAYIADALYELKDNYSNKDVVKIIEFYKLDIDSIKKSIISRIELKSFYDTVYTWEELFSKNRKTDLELTVRKWHKEVLQMLADIEKEMELELCESIHKVIDVYVEDKKRGPYFVQYLLKEQFIPYLQVAIEQLTKQVERMENDKYNLKEENTKSFEEACNVKWNFARREEALDEYLSNIENYYVHLCKLEEARSLATVLQKLCSECHDEIHKLHEDIGKIENYISCYESDVIKEFVTIDMEDDFLDELLDGKNDFYTSCKRVEERLFAEYAEQICDCIKSKMNNLQGEIEGNCLIFYCINLLQSSFKQFTSDVETCIQSNNQVRSARWEKVYEYMEKGIISGSGNGSFKFHGFSEIPDYALETMSIKELIEAHGYCQKLKSNAIFNENIVLNNDIFEIKLFFENNQELIAKCESELSKLKKLEELEHKILNKLLSK